MAAATEQLQKETNKLLFILNKGIGEVATAIAADRSAKGEGRGGKANKSDKVGKEIGASMKAFKSLSAATKEVKDLTKERSRLERADQSLKREATKELSNLSKSYSKQADANKIFQKNTGETAKTLAGLADLAAKEIKDKGGLISANKDAQGSLKDLAIGLGEYNTQSNEAINSMVELQKTVRDEIATGKDLNQIVDDNISLFANVNKTLEKNEVGHQTIGKALMKAGGSAEEFADILAAGQDSLHDSMYDASRAAGAFSASAKSTIADQLTANDKLAGNAEKNQNESHKRALMGQERVLKSLLAGVGTFVARMSKTLQTAATTGFESGGLGGMWDTLSNSFAMGASPEEAQRFAAENRDVLTSIANTAMLSAGEGLKAVETYGDVVNDTFGAVGQKQLEMVSQGITTLSNMGIQATEENFKNFTQGVEDMAKTSNMSAGALFSEFKDMADDPNFQGLMISLGKGADATTLMTDSFASLQANVGMNADEFMKYRKQLAAERSRTGVDRVVQGAFAGQLAESLGFDQATAELLQQGKAYYESLAPEEQKEYDIQYNKLREKLAQERSDALVKGETERVQQLDILAREGGITELTGTIVRKEAGVTGAVQDVQKKRLEASAKNTDALMLLNNRIAEMVSGFAQSPLGQAISMSAVISAATSFGVSSALARGMVGGGGGGGGGMISKIRGAPGAMMGSKMMSGKIGTVIKGFGLLGMAAMAVKGAMDGVEAATNSTGDNVESWMTGVAVGIDSMFLGGPSWVAEGINNMFGEKLKEPFAKLFDTLGLGDSKGGIEAGKYSGASGEVLEAQRTEMRKQAKKEIMAEEKSRMQILENKKRRDTEALAKAQQKKDKTTAENNDENKKVMDKMVAAQEEQTAENKKQTSALTGIKDKKAPDAPLLSASTPSGGGPMDNPVGQG